MGAVPPVPWGQGLFVLLPSDPEPHRTHSGHSGGRLLEEGADGCSARNDGGTEDQAVTHSECAGGRPWDPHLNSRRPKPSEVALV